MPVVEIVVTAEFNTWYQALDDADAEQVTLHVEVLRHAGVALKFPQSSAIKGSKIALRELRIQSGGEPLRVFYTFDPKRQAVLLIGGGKKGNDEFYEEMVPRAEALFAEYIEETNLRKRPKKKR